MLHILGIILITGVCIILSWWLAKKNDILDRPGWDIKPPRGPVPTMQGIGLIIGFFLIMGLLAPEYYLSGQMTPIVIGGCIILIMTTLDEICFLYPRFKKTPLIIFSYPLMRLVVMVLVSIIAYSMGGVHFDEIVVGSIVLALPDWLALTVTVVRFILFINSINRIDGINGISTGVSSIGFLTIYLLISYIVIPLYGVVESDVLMAQQVSLILCIISFCYACFEWKPLGLVRDTGVMFLGYMLAYLSLLGGGKIGIMMVVLALIVFDAIRVIVHRILVLHKNPLKGDLTHLHHRLLACGWSRSEVRVFVRGWSLFLMIIMLLQGSQTVHKIIVFILMAFIFFIVNIYMFWIKKLPSELKK